MENLVFESGIREFNVNDKCVIRFNPTDLNFSEKLINTFNSLSEKQESYKARWEKTADYKEVFALASEMDAQMREAIDDVLGVGTSNALFSDMNVYAMANGLPAWANLLLAIMDEIDTTFVREQKLTNPRISKYTKKYHK